MEINAKATTAGDRPPEAGFVGDVRISGYFRRERPSKLAGARVAFAPGARTPWKINPLGQTIVVLDGEGRVQSDGDVVRTVAAGDVIWWSPGERHWEGATPDHPMSYIALQEEDSGIVRFCERVADDQYAGRVITAELK